MPVYAPPARFNLIAEGRNAWQNFRFAKPFFLPPQAATDGFCMSKIKARLKARL
jgi:hypothetical protein